jgi:hypothetical protein
MELEAEEQEADPVPSLPSVPKPPAPQVAPQALLEPMAQTKTLRAVLGEVEVLAVVAAECGLLLPEKL